MILFDLDGTLTDSGPGITRCVQYALASFGIEEPDLAKTELLRGAAASGIFHEILQALAAKKHSRPSQNTGSGTRQRALFENEVYGGIPEVLAYLKEQGKKFWR